MSPRVINFGCRLNAVEAEVMRAAATQGGAGDAILVNSCAVTGEAVRQARQAIRRARRENPRARIIVSGCAAQIDAEGFAGMDEVDHVIGNDDKLKSETYRTLMTGSDGEARLKVNDIMSVRETASHLIDGLAGRTRAYVEVQNGCDHRCTFCIIPYGRGSSRSVPMGAVVRQIAHLVENGAREVVLTGVDITAYGADLPGAPTLGELAARILKNVPDLPRLRLSSVDAVEIDDRLMRLFAEAPRLMPHLHLSLQAGHDLVLKRMKRRHARADALALAARLREVRPDIAFGADLIAGFPTETDDMFEATRSLIEEMGLAYTHVFPFSPREGTPAARMPQVPRETIKVRAAALRETGARMLAADLAGRVGRADTLLVEEPGRARTESFAPVRIDPSLGAGALVRARLTASSGTDLVAIPLEEAA